MLLYKDTNLKANHNVKRKIIILNEGVCCCTKILI